MEVSQVHMDSIYPNSDDDSLLTRNPHGCQDVLWPVATVAFAYLTITLATMVNAHVVCKNEWAIIANTCAIHTNTFGYKMIFMACAFV
jgi:hypothetical protein